MVYTRKLLNGRINRRAGKEPRVGEHHDLQPVSGEVLRNGSGLQECGRKLGFNSCGRVPHCACSACIRGCASPPTPHPPRTTFEALRERFVGELEQTEGWEVGLGSRAKGALLCRASPEEPLGSCPGLVLCPCWSLIPTPLPSPTQKSRPASPHLSPSPSGNKIKVARDATPVLRKTQLL